MRNNLLKREGNRCSYCGTTTGPFHIDHVIPIWEGGHTRPSNLVVACKPCNQTKGASLDPIWYKRLIKHGNPRTRLIASNLSPP